MTVKILPLLFTFLLALGAASCSNNKEAQFYKDANAIYSRSNAVLYDFLHISDTSPTAIDAAAQSLKTTLDSCLTALDKLPAPDDGAALKTAMRAEIGMWDEVTGLAQKANDSRYTQQQRMQWKAQQLQLQMDRNPLNAAVTAANKAFAKAHNLAARNVLVEIKQHR